MKNAFPWILLIVVLLAVAYFIYKKQAAKNVQSGLTTGTPVQRIPTPTTVRPPVITTTTSIPPVVAGASITNASCLNTPAVVNMIKAFKESKPLQVVLRYEIKETIASICPEAARYLTR